MGSSDSDSDSGKRSDDSRRGSSSSGTSSRSGSSSSSSSDSRSAKSGSASSGKNSDGGKSKKKLKASERVPSSSFQKAANDGQDSENEDEDVNEAPLVGQNKFNGEFSDGLGDDLIGDEEDRRKMEEMTEREREEELYRRAEKREELKKRHSIAQKLQAQISENGDKNSQQEIDRSDGEVFSSPEKEAEMGRTKGYEVKHATKFNALTALKAKREEKEKKDKERIAKEEKDASKRKKKADSSSGSDMEKLARGDQKKKMKASEIYSSSSSEAEERRRSSSSSSSSSSVSSSSGESDTERLDSHKSKKIVKKARNIETIKDLERIRLSRHKLDKFVHLPIFKQTVVGCFVRIAIGQDLGRGCSVYRVAEVTEVCETAKTYEVTKTGSRTNIGLRLKHGKDSKVFRAEFISNSQFSETEFLKWKTACEEGFVDMPTMKNVEEREKAIKRALTYRFSNADVEKILANKKRFQKNPKNYAVFKANLMKDKIQAEAEGNAERAAELDRQLADLEDRAEELDRKRVGTLSNISFINNRNRKQNVERAEKGITADMERKKLEGHVDDPFTRRKTRPILTAPKNKPAPDPSISVSSNKYIPESLKKVEGDQKENKVLLSEVNVKKSESNHSNGDIFNAHDFDIDISIGNEIPPLSTFPVKPVTESSNDEFGKQKKNTIKIDEWKKRRGIL